LVEVQVENKNKDIEATEEDYLRNGWSVLWLEPEDFTDANELCWGRVADLRDKKGACVPVFPKVMRWNEDESEGPLLMYSGEQPPSQDTDRHLDVYYPESVDIGMDAFSWSMEDQYVRLPPEAAFRIVRAEPTRWDCLFSGGRPKTPPQINREIPYAELADEIGEYVPGDTDTEATIELTRFMTTTNNAHPKPFADWVKKEIKTAHKKGADERTRRQRIKDKAERRKYKDVLSDKGERDRSTKKPSLKDLEEVRKDTTLMIVCECGVAVGSFNTFLLHAHTHRIQDEEEAALKASIQDRHRNVREA